MKEIIIFASIALLVFPLNAFGQSGVDDLSELQNANLDFTYEYPATVEQSFDQLAMMAEESGEIRVIIQLDVPVSLEGGMESSEIKSQQDAISGAQNSLLRDLEAAGAAADDSTYLFKHAPFVVTTVNADALGTLQSSSMIANVFPDIPEPPLLRDSTTLIGADDVWNPALTGGSFTGAGWQIVVLDSGVDKNHSFLTGKVVSEACYSSTFTADNSQSLCPGGVSESILPNSGMPCTGINGCDHGTHVAGIAAGDTFQWLGNTYRGVAPEAEIIAIQVFSQFNDPSSCFFSPPCILSYRSDQMKALDHALDLAQDPNFNVASVNLSLGGGQFTSACDNDSRKPFIDQLRSLGVATIIASGNDGFQNAISTPACISSAISVGSTTKSDAVSSFSNSSPLLDILAPGQSIASSILNNGFAIKSGTSMATPHVAGAWALLQEKAAMSAQPTPLGVDDGLQALNDFGVPVTDSKNGLTHDRIQMDLTVPVIVPEFPMVVLILAASIVPIVLFSKRNRLSI